MENLFLSKSISLYLKNFRTSLIFALLLVSVVFFSSFPNFLVSSGTIFFSYSLSFPEIGVLATQIVGMLVFLLFYSFFVTVIVFSVRKELSHVKLSYYVAEAIRKFSFKMLAFFAFFVAVLYLLQLFFLSIGLHPVASALILLVLTAMFIFVPQAIVIEEESLLHGLQTNFDFIMKNPRSLLLVLAVGALLLAVLQFVEFGIDRAFLLGNYVSLLVVMLFIQPFLEIFKTYLYMVNKFDLIREHELKTS